MIHIKAEGFALCAHRNQKYGNRPYSEHLRETAAIAEKFNLSRNVIAACWLHDTVEDTATVSYSHILEHFGPTIANIVSAVTDAPGPNRKQRKAATYQKIAANPDAILVKLCDRIANIEACEKDNPELLKMYLDEHADFVHHLYKGQSPIWNYYFDLLLRVSGK